MIISTLGNLKQKTDAESCPATLAATAAAAVAVAAALGPQLPQSGAMRVLDRCRQSVGTEDTYGSVSNLCLHRGLVSP